MEELTIEQKAKAYDEAIEVARKYWNSPRTCIDIDVLPELFPEIKEIDDEEIRKGLIAIITDFDSLYLQENYSLSREEAIAWLEEQGEHANFRNKIQIGDKVTRNEDGVLVNLSQLKRVAKKDEKQGEQKPAEWSEDDENLLKLSLENLTELKDRFGEEYGKVGDCIVFLESIKDRVQPLSKQEWGEEDKAMMNLIIARLHSHPNVDLEEYSKEYDWLKNKLKSLRPQSTWKPSDEQMEALNNIKVTGCISYAGQGQELDNLYQDLNKLREE